MAIVATSPSFAFQELSACSLALASLAVELRALWSERGQCEDPAQRAKLLREYRDVYALWDRAYVDFDGAFNTYVACEAQTAVRIRDDYAQRTQTGA